MGYLLTILASFFEATIITIGAHLTISLGGIIFFGLPTLYSAGAYSFVIANTNGYSFYESGIITTVVVLFISLLFVLAYNRLSSDSFAIFSFTSVLAFDALVKSWDPVTGGILGISGITRPLAVGTLSQLVWLELIILIILLIAEFIFLKSRYGRTLLGLRENTQIISSLGASYKKLAFSMIIIASFLAGIAGVLTVWRIQFLDPSFAGMSIVIKIATAAILAVKPKIRWLVGSVLLISLLPEVIRFFDLPSMVMGHLRVLIYTIILIIVLRNLSNLLNEKRLV